MTTTDEHQHEWDVGAWGVIIGVSRCLECGAVSRREDFPAADRRRMESEGP